MSRRSPGPRRLTTMRQWRGECATLMHCPRSGWSSGFHSSVLAPPRWQQCAPQRVYCSACRVRSMTKRVAIAGARGSVSHSCCQSVRLFVAFPRPFHCLCGAFSLSCRGLSLSYLNLPLHFHRVCTTVLFAFHRHGSAGAETELFGVVDERQAKPAL